MTVLQGLCGYNIPNLFSKSSQTGLYAAWKGETGDDRLFLAAFTNRGGEDVGGWANLGTIPGSSSIGPALAMVNDTLFVAWKGEQDAMNPMYSNSHSS